MSDLQTLEDITDEAMAHFDVGKPPVPIDGLLQTGIPEMWEKVDVTQLSGSFLSIKHRFSPRMSLARMMARQIVYSPWGRNRNLIEMVGSDEQLMRVFARMLIMPRVLITQMPAAARNDPAQLEVVFEVPDDEAEKRIEELSLA